jgi:hypothetical protein
MQFRWGRILVATTAVVSIAILCPVETVTEINAATGSTRTRGTVAGFIKGSWKESPTWVSERAKDLGIATDREWQRLGSSRLVGFTISNGCSRAPVSYQLKSFPGDEIPEEQRDAFVRRFAGAPEKERQAILRQLNESLASTDPPRNE